MLQSLASSSNSYDMLKKLGPVSKVKPSFLIWFKRPPGLLFFSSIVTSNPRLASRRPEASPPRPAPVITTFVLIDFDLFYRLIVDEARLLPTNNPVQIII